METLVDLDLWDEEINREFLNGHVEFVFDDEPLERILYGENLHGPTAANYFAPGRAIAQRIVQAYEERNIKGIIESACELAASTHPISLEVCFKLAFLMGSIVPNRPNPVIDHDLSGLTGLLERLWSIGLAAGNTLLRDKAGASLYRLYEHYRRYEDARKVLAQLIVFCQEEHQSFSEAVHINNFAFEYLLEGKWREAMPLFENAADMFEKNGIEFQYANSRANYWTCRIECGDLEDIDQTRAELKSLSKTLARFPGWSARKPLISLAKIEAGRGNISAAIRLVKRAIEVTRESQTRYPELDAEYLEHLKRMKKRHK